MNADQQLFEDTIREAVAERSVALEADVPDFGTILAGRQRRTHRMLTAATLAVAVLGIGGVLFATTRANSALDAVPADGADSDPGSDSRTTVGDVVRSETTVLPLPSSTVEPSPTEFACTDPIGEDQLGRQLFGSCEPMPGDVAGDYACNDRIGTENGFVIFTNCEPVGQLGPIPGGDNAAPFDNLDDISVRPTTYVVQPGDYAIKIAGEFCVSIADLEAANGWDDNTREFPGPGSEILIPADYDESTCDIGSYTITEDDTSRIAVADKFCISVQALDAANLETPGYEMFFPGLSIIIPPDGSNTC